MVQRISVSLAIVVIGCVLGANVYNSVVDARIWGTSIPGSLTTAREYFSVINPGTFFRVASPLAQLASLAVLIACWRYGSGVRWLAGSALLLCVLTDVLTFTYFYPRNEILLLGETAAPAVLTDAWREWSTMNYVRSAMVLAAMVCELVVLGRLPRGA